MFWGWKPGRQPAGSVVGRSCLKALLMKAFLFRVFCLLTKVWCLQKEMLWKKKGNALGLSRHGWSLVETTFPGGECSVNQGHRLQRSWRLWVKATLCGRKVAEGCGPREHPAPGPRRGPRNPAVSPRAAPRQPPSSSEAVPPLQEKWG